MVLDVQSSTCDLISEMPDNVVESILTCLPLRDAVRTSILSRKWRYYWTTIPKLVFDDTLFPDIRDPVFYSATIFLVLLYHRGPILNFILSVSRVESSSRIDQTIHFLSTSGVQEFTLHIRTDEPYKLPSPFFSFQQLMHLNLRFCEFRPPPSFDGFSRLVSLNFYQIDIDDVDFANLISKCPLLSSVTLEGSLFYNALELDAPVLEILCVDSNFSFVHFKNTPLLKSVSITSHETSELREDKLRNIGEVFRCLPALEEIYMGDCFLQFLIRRDGVPEQLPFVLNPLKVFDIDLLCFGKVIEVSFVLCLLRSAPNLEKLIITVHGCEDDKSEDHESEDRESKDEVDGDEQTVVELLEMQHYSNVSFNRLREVELSFVWESIAQLEFIRLILAKSPGLEKMRIKPNSEDTFEQLKIVKEVTKFKRVSPRAEIIFD